MFTGFVRLAGNPRINLQLEAKGSDFRSFSEGRPCLWPVACNPGRMLLLGHELPRRQQASAAAITPIVLQKSKVEAHRIFSENTKRETIADSYILNRVAEVACELDVRGCVPSHLYTKGRAYGPQNF